MFGFQPFTMSHYRQAVHTLTELAMQTDKGIVLASALIEHLRRQSVILPTINAIERASAEAISLAHLAPIDRRIDVPLRGGFSKKILVEFRFSCHCYSRGPSKDETIPPALRVPDGSVHTPRDRIFDQRRYDLSFNVVACIDALIASQGDVNKSRHDNFFRVDTLTELVGGMPQPVSFYIFMSAKKVTDPGMEKRIRIYVESAYPELPNVPAPHSTRALPFGAVLGTVWAP